MDIKKIKEEVKYLLFDLDGTLVNNDRELAEENRKIAPHLRKHGLRHSIITGRPYYMMLQEIDQMQPTLPIVASNGAAVLDGSDPKNPLFSDDMDQALANELIAFFLDSGLNFYVYTPDQIYVGPTDFAHLRNWNDVVRRMPEKYRWEILPVKRYDRSEPVAKFLVWSETQDKDHDAIVARFGDRISIAKSTRYSIDIGGANTNKGSGFSRLAQMLGASPNEFMVFGDGGNDLPMFALAKHSVALANAPDFVKAKAAFVTEHDNHSGGVYRFIKKIWD